VKIDPGIVLAEGWVYVPEGEPEIDPDEQLQQVGIDLRLEDVSKIDGQSFIPSQGKSHIAQPRRLRSHMYREQIGDSNPDRTDTKNIAAEGWILEPGFYEFGLIEHCKIPQGYLAHIWGRSSLVRSGTLALSMVYDPGFESQLSVPAIVHVPIHISYHARVAQIVFEEVGGERIYDGQYQGRRTDGSFARDADTTS